MKQEVGALANSLKFSVSLRFAIINDLRPFPFLGPLAHLIGPQRPEARSIQNCSASYTINGSSGSATLFAPTC